MVRLEQAVAATGGWLNYAACFAVVVMMLLSCADVVLRLIGAPIPGTYEMVGFIGTVIVSFSLAYTSQQRGHVAVEFVVERFPAKVQFIVGAGGNLLSAILFGIISWQSLAYGLDLHRSGEVSLTLQMPLHPFVYGIAVGCTLLTLALLTDLIRSVRRGLGK